MVGTHLLTSSCCPHIVQQKNCRHTVKFREKCSNTMNLWKSCQGSKAGTKHFDTELFKSSLAGSEFLFGAFCCSCSGKIKYNEVKERIELNLSPLCCHSVLRSLSSPWLYLCPVNLTQPSSQEDLGSNKDLTPWPSGLRPRWRRWLQRCQPSASRLLTPTLPPHHFFYFPSFTTIPHVCFSLLLPYLLILVSFGLFLTFMFFICFLWFRSSFFFPPLPFESFLVVFKFYLPVFIFPPSNSQLFLCL